MDLNHLKKIEARLLRINKSNIAQRLKDEIQANEEEILNLIRNRWTLGKRPDGNIIGVYKSAEYALFKHTINPLAGGNVDLTVTRSLRNKLEIFSMGNSLFEIFSTDSKALELAEKYGLDVYGLSKEEENIVLNEAKEQLYQDILNDVFK